MACQIPCCLSDEIDSLLDKEFAWRGRGPDKFDCLGVILWLYDRCLCIDLPDPMQLSCKDTVDAFKAHFRLVDAPEPYDLIYVEEKSGFTGTHVAMVENEKWAIHAVGNHGFERARLTDFYKARPEFYRLKNR